MRKYLIELILVPALAACGGNEKPQASTLEDPTAVSAVAGENSVTLSWTDNASSEEGYYVFMDNDSKPYGTLPANATSFVFEELKPGSSVRCGVQAFGGNFSFSRLVWAEPVTIPVPPEPEPEPEPDPNPIDAITFNWTEVSVSGLPAAVKVYKTTDKLAGRNFNAWYATASTKDVDFRVLYPGNGVTKTIDEQASADDKCLVLINGGIFSFTYKLPIGFAIFDGIQTPWRVVEDDGLRIDREYWSADGKLHPVSRALFGTDKDGVPGVYWSFTPSHGTVYVYDKPIPSIAGESPSLPGSTTFPCTPSDWKPFQAVTCGPVLLKDGRCPINAEKTSRGYWKTNYELWADDIYGVAQRADRTSVGYTKDGNIILFICDGRIDASQGATTLEVAAIMKGLGCVGAINLDGGGSTGMWVAGQHINDQTGGNRAVMSTLGFFSK